MNEKGKQTPLNIPRGPVMADISALELNQDEKERLQDEVRALLQVEFEDREKELRQSQRAEIEKIQADFSRRLENWSRGANETPRKAQSRSARRLPSTGNGRAGSPAIFRSPGRR